MNYLAHLDLANKTKTSLVGAFLGDFIKGDQYLSWQPATQVGILLHRKVDTFTDSHPFVADYRRRFPASLRRVAGIILDIYFDHALAKKISRIQQDKDCFLSDFYDELATVNLPEHRHFQRLQESLLAGRWLLEYQHLDICSRAFEGIERRLNGKVAFASMARQFIEDNHQELQQLFDLFYPELQAFSVVQAKQLTQLHLPH